MDDLLREFLTESNESIAVLDGELVKLEQNPNDPDMLANIFRLVHTIKGTCGFLNLPRLEAVAHAAENVLGKLREGKLEVTPEAITIVLESFDRIKDIMAVIESTENEPDGDNVDLIDRLNALVGEDGLVEPTDAELEASFNNAAGAQAPESMFDRVGGKAAVETATQLFHDKLSADKILSGVFDGADDEAQHVNVEAFLTVAFEGPSEHDGDELSAVCTRMLGGAPEEPHFDAVVVRLNATLAEMDVASEVAGEVVDFVIGARDAVLGRSAPAAKAEPESSVVAETQRPATADEEKLASGGARAAEAKSGETSIANQTIRVNVELLEGLMNLVSELVLSRNQLLQMVRGSNDSEFEVPLQRLSHVTSDLQEGVMKTRMQPIGNAWAKLPRLVRDLALDLGKKISLDMNGADTELDRQVLELIKDPLTHMVRNSADHGLETTEKRKKAGKPETGRIVLNAYHEGGHIVIEITDDGQGIPIEPIKQKAISQGLVNASDAENMSDQQIQQFIFKPGFSLASKVTNVSGRGVGMDVVRTNVEKIGGTVELKSKEGEGSSFIIKIPLTLAIVSALIVEAADERFAIPQIAVNSLLRVSGTSEHKIETINETPVLRLRNRLLPLVSLSEVLRLNGDEEGEAADASNGFVIVTQVGNYAFGIIVDKVFDTEEIVIKPVAPILRHINIFSGNTILGDGSVIMILDPNGMAAATGEVGVSDSVSEEATKRGTQRDDRTALLVFKAGSDEPKAVPLGLIARLEEIEVDSLENSNERLVVQYRGQLMPLIKMDDSYELRTEGRQPILVFTDQDRSMGLVVDEIMDIVEEHLDVELASDQDGRLGSVVIGGKATELIDTAFYLSKALGDWFSRNDNTIEGMSRGDTRVLLVDDSPFFRNLLQPLLVTAGYSVTTAEGADVALKLREDGEDFDIIVSDIEMPGMSGFEFLEEVKQDSRWQGTPVVALSSHTTAADFDRGREAGFSDYVAKSDGDALLNTLSQTLAAGTSGGAA